MLNAGIVDNKLGDVIVATLKTVGCDSELILAIAPVFRLQSP